MPLTSNNIEQLLFNGTTEVLLIGKNTLEALVEQCKNDPKVDTNPDNDTMDAVQALYNKTTDNIRFIAPSTDLYTALTTHPLSSPLVLALIASKETSTFKTLNDILDHTNSNDPLVLTAIIKNTKTDSTILIRTLTKPRANTSDFLTELAKHQYATAEVLAKILEKTNSDNVDVLKTIASNNNSTSIILSTVLAKNNSNDLAVLTAIVNNSNNTSNILSEVLLKLAANNRTLLLTIALNSKTKSTDLITIVNNPPLLTTTDLETLTGENNTNLNIRDPAVLLAIIPTPNNDARINSTILHNVLTKTNDYAVLKKLSEKPQTLSTDLVTIINRNQLLLADLINIFNSTNLNTKDPKVWVALVNNPNIDQNTLTSIFTKTTIGEPIPPSTSLIKPYEHSILVALSINPKSHTTNVLEPIALHNGDNKLTIGELGELLANPNINSTITISITTKLVTEVTTNNNFSVLTQYKNSIHKFPENEQQTLVPYVFKLNNHEVAANMSATSRKAIGKLILQTR